MCIVLPPSFGNMKSLRDENGRILEGSVSEKINVDINGTSLGMFIVGKDTSKPILLFLGGDPGIPEYFLETQYPSGLENEFVVCYLEYRGTSLSYHPDILPETLTTEQYLEDAVGVTNYLRERFGQEKIYLMGHSFGTYIGILTASRHSELYQAYIAMSERYPTEKMTTDELKVLIWRYFMSYWNNRRICSANGGLPPMVKRRQYYDSLKKTA